MTFVCVAHNHTFDKVVRAGRSAAARAALDRLDKLTAFLADEFEAAAEDARDAFSLSTLAELVTDASSGYLFKSEEDKPISFNAAQPLDLTFLGQPYKVLEVSILKLNAAWADEGFDYEDRPDPVIMASIRRSADRGVELPPPAIAWTHDGWGFFEGRGRFLYMREAGFETMPVAVPMKDADRLWKAAGMATLSAGTGGAVHADAFARPYADILDAVDHVSFQVAQRFATACMMVAIVGGEAETARISRLLDLRAQRAAKLTTVMDFETPNINALNELRMSLMGLIREVSDDQRAAILQALKEGIARGLNPIDIARTFRGTIGLTANQERYITNYRNALSQAHAQVEAKVDALGRALRDGRFDSSVVRAFETGKALTPAQIDKMVQRYRERWLKHRAETIARTEALTAAHMGELAAWEAAIDAGDIQAQEIVQTWVSAHDSRVRNTHRVLDTQQRRWGKPFDSISGAKIRFPGDPLAPAAERINCFPAGTIVAGNAKSAMRQWYEGDLVEIVTARGHKLAGSPNHPILTERGWIALGALMEGDYIFSCSHGKRVADSNPYVDNAQITIDNVFHTLAANGIIERVPFFAVDFHGDRPNHDIDIVRSERVLRLGFESMGFKVGSDVVFEFSDLSRFCERSIMKLCNGAWSSAQRIMSGLRKFFPTFMTSASHALKHCLATVSRLYPGIAQMQENSAPFDFKRLSDGFHGHTGLKHRCYFGNIGLALDGPSNRRFFARRADCDAEGFKASPDCCVTDVIALGDGQSAQSGMVERDDVIYIKRFQFHGYLYNIETVEGFYIANGIVVQNCRCVLTRQISEVPLNPDGTPTVDYAEELAHDAAGTGTAFGAEGEAVASVEANQGYELVRDAGDLGGMKPKQIWKDADGNEYLFKPVAEGDEFLAEAEIAGSKLSQMVNPLAPDVEGITLDGKFGSFQKLITNSGDISKIELERMTQAQLAAIQKEQVVDWLISNADAHPENFLKVGTGKSPKIVPIDKGQAFKYFGKDLLDITWSAPTNQVGTSFETIYSRLWRKYARGGAFADNISLKPTFDAVRKLQGISDRAFRDLLTPYAESRFKGDERKIKFFLDLAVQRKNSLEVDFRRFFLSLENVEVEGLAALRREGFLGESAMSEAADRLTALNLDGAISNEEAGAILSYTGNLYTLVNRPLIALAKQSADATASEWKQWGMSSKIARLIDSAIARLPAYNGVVFRNVRLAPRDVAAFMKDYVVGQPVVWPGLSSSSQNAKVFAGDANVRFVINSKTGRSVAGLSSNPDEQEVLFATGSRFIVRKVEKSGGAGAFDPKRFVIYLDDVSKGIDFNKI